MEENKIPDEDLDEEAVEPLVEPVDSQARIKYIQCLEIILCSAQTEEVTVHEEKDGDWGGGILPPAPGLQGHTVREERSQETPTTVSKVEEQARKATREFGREATQTAETR